MNVNGGYSHFKDSATLNEGTPLRVAVLCQLVAPPGLTVSPWCDHPKTPGTRFKDAFSDPLPGFGHLTGLTEPLDHPNYSQKPPTASVKHHHAHKHYLTTLGGDGIQLNVSLQTLNDRSH